MDGTAGGSEGHSGGHPLFRRESAKRSFSTMADGHRRDRDTSPDTLFVSEDDHYHNEHLAQRQRLANRIALPPLRRPGDGLDMRRPVMSGSGGGTRSNSPGQTRNASVGVIDLTEDDESQHHSRQTPAATGEAFGGASRAQRGPRFGRDIIDLDESDGDAEEQTQRPPQEAPLRTIPTATRPNYMNLFPARAPTRTHPHPQFSNLRRPERASPPPQMREPPTRFETQRTEAQRANMDDLHGLRRRLDDDLRSRLRTGGRLDSESTRGHRSVTPYPNGQPEPIDLTSDDDEVVLVDVRTRAGVNAEPPTTAAGAGTRAGNGYGDMLADYLVPRTGRLYDRLMAFTGIPRTHAHAHHVPGGAHVAFVPDDQARAAFAAVDLDFGATAFDMGLGGNRPPPPKYEPPPAAEPGFTYSPGEDEIVVCPNCGDELAVSDDETKAEIWVIKKCGHAYCGDCAQHRAKMTKGKGKAPAHTKPMPFKACVVFGCNEKVAGAKSMMHIFIGS